MLNDPSNHYHKRSPWCASLNHLLCAQKLPSITPSNLTPTTASWAEWHCFDSWENWGSERLNNLPTVTSWGRSRVGFKLSLISLQSLLYEKWPSSCFLCPFITEQTFLSTHLYVKYSDQHWRLAGKVRDSLCALSEALKGRAEVKQQCFYSPVLNNRQSTCGYSTWQFTKHFMSIFIVQLHQGNTEFLSLPSRIEATWETADRLTEIGWSAEGHTAGLGNSLLIALHTAQHGFSLLLTFCQQNLTPPFISVEIFSIISLVAISWHDILFFLTLNQAVCTHTLQTFDPLLGLLFSFRFCVTWMAPWKPFCSISKHKPKELDQAQSAQSLFFQLSIHLPCVHPSIYSPSFLFFSLIPSIHFVFPSFLSFNYPYIYLLNIWMLATYYEWDTF